MCNCQSKFSSQYKIFNTICGYVYLFSKGCSKVYIGTTGTVMSPNYPKNYPNNRICKSKIKVATGSRVQLSFTNIDIEPDPSCGYDSLSIYNGPDETAPLLGRYCGTHAASALTSSSSEVLIIFNSDLSNTGRGFQVTYNSISGGRSYYFIHIIMIETLYVANTLNTIQARCDDIMNILIGASRQR